MTRPTDWAPLASSDPLAGSPEEILEQAARLRDAVAELTWQVNTLKRIGVGDKLLGAYTEALKVSGADVAANLEKLIHRYRRLRRAECKGEERTLVLPSRLSLLTSAARNTARQSVA